MKNQKVLKVLKTFKYLSFKYFNPLIEFNMFSSLNMVFPMYHQKSKATPKSIHGSHATSLHIINLSCLKHLLLASKKRDNIGYLHANRLLVWFFGILFSAYLHSFCTYDFFLVVYY